MRKTDSINLNNRLQVLSEILKKEEIRLLPQYLDFIDDATFRSSELWRIYFSKGILLSSGGVETSLFGLEYFESHPSLKSFNKYPGSTNAYAALTQELCKKFLLEEGLISPSQNQNSLIVAYSLGSHEGLIRVARIIFKPHSNDGIFVAMGSYGLTAGALRDMKPLKYRVCLVKNDSNRGEKISLYHLEALVKDNPSIKTLFLELKTTAGAVYTESEMRDVINFCNKHQLFLIMDAAHLHMEFHEKYRFSCVSSLCQQLNYHQYVVLFTASKTYGFERARIGFVLFDNLNQSLTLKAMDDQLIRMFGTFNDFPIVAAYSLITFSLIERQKYLKANVCKHRYNMNLMLAYIEGISSLKIDEDLRLLIRKELPEKYETGIKDLRVIWKPESGLHLKIDVSLFQSKYFLNIQMYNSEIICYVMNKTFGVVTLHAFQIMDPDGYSMRLGFSSKKDVHMGMQLMHDFFASLTDNPESNPYMEKVLSIDTLRRRPLESAPIRDTTRLFKPTALLTDVRANYAIRSNL